MNRNLGFAVTLLVVFLGWLEVRGDSSVNNTRQLNEIPDDITVGTRRLDEIPDDITVGVYYYPWHGNDFHRDGGYMRDLLEPKHRPKLGEYDDSKPETIAQHLTWSRQANVKLWVCSWWGPGSREDKTIKNVILKHPDLNDHKIAILYESLNRVREDEGFQTGRVATDMQYLCPTYFNHPNYYRVDGRPVIFMYLTRVLTNRGVLGETIRVMRENCKGYDVFIVGDQVWKNAPPTSSEYDPFNHLDGVTNYDIYGNMNNPPYAGQAAVDKYYDQQLQWRERANAKGVRYAVAASPGYNDRGVRMESNHMGLSRRLTPDSEPGTLFVAQLERARHITDPTMGNLLMINSFNEWHEDSQIEPVVGDPTTLPQHITNGIEYSGYGELYLNILREATCGQKCRKQFQLPKYVDIVRKDPFLGPPPTNVLVGAYYYAWYGSDFHGHQDYLRQKLDLPQWPSLGEYDDTLSYVIAEHLGFSRRANIGLWITRWIRPGTREDLTIRNSILPHPDLQNHMISLLYTTDIFKAADFDPVKIKGDVEYLCDAYFNSQNYYHIHGRPVLFLSLTRKLDQLGVLESVTSLIRNVASSFGYDVYLVGDQVWKAAPSSGELYMPFLLLDAITNIDMYGNIGSQAPYAGQDAIDTFYQKQRDWRDRAWSRNCGFIPGATPGFNNLNHNPLSRQLTADDEPGSLFASSLKKARYLVDSNVDNLIVVNSFNNWFEDTQLEPVLGRSTTAPADVTEGLEYHGYETLYLDILRDATIDSPSGIDSSHIREVFYPLQCNVFYDMTMACSTKWSSMFGSADKHNAEVVIPCGQCITMDQTGTLALDGGLDIQGILVFPDGIQLELRAPFIRVQGELHANSRKIVDGVPNLKFTIWEGEPGIEKFKPVDVNEDACGVQRCEPGSKSIVVAGGRVQIHGLPEDTPTWVKLRDVVTDIKEPTFRLPLSCPNDGDLINESFTSPYNVGFSGTPGSTVEFTGSSLKVIDRRVLRHGLQIDLSTIRNCLLPGSTYIVSVKLRLTKDGHEGKSTECAETAQNCLKIQADSMNANEQLSSSVKFSESSGSSLRYSEWTTLKAQISFTELELKESNIFLLLRIGDTGKGVDIEIESFALRLSPADACSNSPPDCRDLISCNGSADLGLTDLSPVSKRGNVELKVEEEDGNPFWRMRRLGPNDVLAGLQISLPVSCMTTSAVYRFRMKVRVHPDSQSRPEVEVAAYIGSYTRSISPSTGNKRSFKVAACPKSAGDWVICEDYFVMPTLNPELETLDLFFETALSPTVTYDIDELSMEYVHIESPVTGLVLDGGVRSNWGAGAEILITSYTIDWNDEQTRVIANIKDRGDGTVLVELDKPITRPPTERGSPYGVEVSLLSRNIIFEGAQDDGADAVRGGHFMVYHTPEVKQVIEGAEFRNFGQQGSAGRFPIYFHYCGNIAGSRIAKNSIRDSNQRCIVLAGTDNAWVEENIAYNTAGHCFVLQDGAETGNHFLRNLGAKTRKANTVIPGSGIFAAESDDYPSTFFSTSPSNTWEDNVGAGSEADGFTFELQSSVKGRHSVDFSSTNPAALPLTLFKDNVAHSNQRNGVRLSLPSSYPAQTVSSFDLYGVRAYRNLGAGMLLMNSESVSVVGGHFADNRNHIHVHHSENVTIKDTTLVGMTSETRQLEATQHGMTLLCPDRRAMTGIEIDSFTRRQTGVGLTVENLRMYGFSDMRCRENAFRVDPEIGWGVSDFFSSIGKIEINDEAPRLTLCDANQAGIQDIYMIDQDSSLKPSRSTATGVSALVSDHRNLLHFIPNNENKCQFYSEGCYHYCAETCLRSVSYSMDPADPNTYQLRVCERGNLNHCQFYEGHTREESDTSHRFVRHGKHFYVALPTGRYDAAFIDANGKIAWPTFVEEVYHPALCNGAVADGSIWLLEPNDATDLEKQCLGLIQNGGAEYSNTDHPYWLAGPDGIFIAEFKGITTPGTGNLPGNALCHAPHDSRTENTIGPSYSMGQYVNTRCLIQNRRYRVNAWVRRSKANVWTNGGPIFLDETNCETNCVEAGFHLIGSNGSSFTIKMNSSFNIFAADGNSDEIGKRVRGLRTMGNDYNGYYLVEGELSVTADVASAVSAFFYIHHNHDDSDVVLCVDDVSITLVV